MRHPAIRRGPSFNLRLEMVPHPFPMHYSRQEMSSRIRFNLGVQHEGIAYIAAERPLNYECFGLLFRLHATHSGNSLTAAKIEIPVVDCTRALNGGCKRHRDVQ